MEGQDKMGGGLGRFLGGGLDRKHHHKKHKHHHFRPPPFLRFVFWRVRVWKKQNMSLAEENDTIVVTEKKSSSQAIGCFVVSHR